MTLNDSETVLSINEAFYDAFVAGDVKAMDAIWSRSVDISCLHPGWPVLLQQEGVRQSWHDVLTHPTRPHIECVAPTARVYGETAVVVCYEKLDGGYLLATNIYHRDPDGWRMVHHQAGGPVPAPRDPES